MARLPWPVAQTLFLVHYLFDVVFHLKKIMPFYIKTFLGRLPFKNVIVFTLNCFWLHYFFWVLFHFQNIEVVFNYKKIEVVFHFQKYGGRILYFF